MKIKLNRKRLFVALLLVLCVCSLALSIGVTMARYVLTSEKDNLEVPKSFYFESNLLTLSGEASYEINVNTIRFELMPYADAERLSEVDITYEVTITDGSNPATFTTSQNTSGTLEKNTSTATEVVFDGLEYGKTYTVTANATAPYTKTLSATFTVVEEFKALSYTVDTETSEDYVLVTVKTNEETCLINLHWQKGYVPDSTYSPLVGASGTAVYDVSLKGDSVYVFRFLKSDTSVSPNEADFYVEISSSHEPEDENSTPVTDVEDGAWE